MFVSELTIFPYKGKCHTDVAKKKRFRPLPEFGTYNLKQM